MKCAFPFTVPVHVENLRRGKFGEHLSRKLEVEERRTLAYCGTSATVCRLQLS